MKVDQSSPDIQHLLVSDLSVLEFVAQDLPASAPEMMCEIQKKWNMAVKNLKTSIDKNQNSEALPECYTANGTGGFEAKGDGDSFGDSVPVEIDVIDDGKKELGRGKRSKQANRLYLDFWRHDSGTSDSSDNED